MFRLTEFRYLSNTHAVAQATVVPRRLCSLRKFRVKLEFRSRDPISQWYYNAVLWEGYFPIKPERKFTGRP